MGLDASLVLGVSFTSDLRELRCAVTVARPLRACKPAAGQGIVEYGLILSLSALLAIVLLVFFGGTLSAFLQAIGDAIDAAS